MSSLKPKFSARVGVMVVVALAVALIGAGCGGEDAAAEAVDQAASKAALTKELANQTQEAALAGDASAEATATKAFNDGQDAFAGASSNGDPRAVKFGETADAYGVFSEVNGSAAGTATEVRQTVVSAVQKVICIEATSAQNNSPPRTAAQWEAEIDEYIQSQLGSCLSAQIVNALYLEVEQRVNKIVTAIDAVIRAEPTHRDWYLHQVEAYLQC